MRRRRFASVRACPEALTRRQVGRRDHRGAGAAPDLSHRARRGDSDRRPRRWRRLISAEWFPDGKRLLVCGSEASHAPRCYSVDRAGSAPRPMTPEGVLATLAPDGKTLLLAMPDGGVPAVVDRRRCDPAGPGTAARRPPDCVERATAGRSTCSGASRRPPPSSASRSRRARARSCARLTPEGVGADHRALRDGLGRRRPLVRLLLHEPALDAVCRDTAQSTRLPATGGHDSESRR